MSKRNLVMIWLFVGAFALISASQFLQENVSASLARENSSSWKMLPEETGWVSRFENGKVICQSADGQSIESITESSHNLQNESSPRQLLTAHGTGNITFILRAGAGLEANPQAQEAYLKAAQIWASLIEAPSPVTIVIDVDYGPTVFGQPGILGQARPQALIGNGEYSDWRTAVIANANSGKDLALFSALPETAVPTDIGDIDTFVMPSAVLRVVGLIPAVADPEGEMSQFGPPPAIGFLSTVPWDFNPDDGIGQGQLDFVGTALHEIGHVIGFITRVGSTDLNPNVPQSVSAFDIYRFRPGTTTETFTTANRILSPGGEHFHYAGEKDISLSTSRLNLTGGDGFGADHWKDIGLFGSRLGVMAPRQLISEKFGVSNNDLIALEAMGYRIVGESMDHSPFIGSIKGDIQGDLLTLTGAVYDIDADIAAVQITLLDGSGNVLREDAPFAFGDDEKVNRFILNLVGLSDLPAAVRARVSFTDAAGNADAPVITSFGLADAGGPTIDSASFNGKKLIIKGKDLSGSLQIEINNVVVATKNNSSSKKVKIKGRADALNIRAGANRLRVIKNTARSNIAVLVDGMTVPENRVEFITTPRLTTDHNRAYNYHFEAKSLSGGLISYEVQAPSWVIIDPVENSLSGLAGWQNAQQTFDVVIRASDGVIQGEQRFSLQVKLGEILCDSEFGEPSESPYVLPFQIGKRFMVNQGYCPPNPNWGHHNWFALDFEMPIGTRIAAARSGEVIFTEERYTDGNRQPGQENHIFILHDDGTVAQYTHLTKNGALVETGDRVTQGQVIGLSGDTGASSGPHLHFVVYRGQFNYSRQYSTPVNFKNADGMLNAQRGLIFQEWYEAKPY